RASDAEMVAEARASLRHARGPSYAIPLDLRYGGRAFPLQAPVPAAALRPGDHRGIRRAFDAMYEHRYAHHSPEEPVEMVNIRLAVIGKRPRLRFPTLGAAKTSAPTQQRHVYLSDPSKPVSCPVYDRAALGAGARLDGPALIQEHGTTTVLFERDTCEVASSGELVI